jgi:hypothetical protein
MTAIDELVYQLDEAFSGKGIEKSNESQSLVVNLASVGESTWREVPPGGTRTIESIVLHVGSCKVMYDDYAFGPGTLRWDSPDVEPWRRGEAPLTETIDWLERSHRRFVDHVRALDDGELAILRKANWGEMRETRWLISVIIQHDAYHAGEINHIRSVLVGDDAWMWG